VLLDWWSKHSYGKHLYIGQAVYRVGGKGWEDPEELSNQVTLNRKYAEVHGSMYFNSKTFLQNKENVNAKMGEIYPHKALIPTMSWIDAHAPEAPGLEALSGSQGEGVHVSWKDSAQSDAAYYVIYRFSQGESVSSDNPAHIVAIVQRTPSAIQLWDDKTTARRKQYTYGISAVDRGHNESQLSREITIRTKGKRGKIKVLSPIR
jgi:hypothetical protein